MRVQRQEAMHAPATVKPRAVAPPREVRCSVASALAGQPAGPAWHVRWQVTPMLLVDLRSVERRQHLPRRLDSAPFESRGRARARAWPHLARSHAGSGEHHEHARSLRRSGHLGWPRRCAKRRAQLRSRASRLVAHTRNHDRARHAAGELRRDRRGAR